MFVMVATSKKVVVQYRKNTKKGITDREVFKGRKWLTEARTAWKSGRLGDGRILVWKPFLIGFRLEFDGVADVVIARKVKNTYYTKCIVGVDSISALF